MFQKISKFFLYASVFSIALVATSTFFPFIGVKYYFFRVVIELALLFYLLYWAFEAKINEVKNRLLEVSRRPLFIAVSIFVLAFLLASIFALNSHAAFWSNFERGEGGFQMIHYYLFFFLLIIQLKEWKEWRLLFWLSVGAAFLMVLYGFLAQVGVNGLISPLRGDTSGLSISDRIFSPRFQGSLGNPAYVAPYLLFTLFFTSYLWLVDSKKTKSSRFLIYGGLSLVFLLFFILSQTRGAFLGLIGAIFAFFICSIIISSKRRKINSYILLGIILVGSIFIVFRHNPIIQKLPGSRLLQIADTGYETDSIRTRLWTWGSAWRAFKDRPIFGWGPENFSAAFDKHFDPRHFSPEKNSETWFDRAHSIVFDYLSTTGLIGFLAYLSIFIIFFRNLFQGNKFIEKNNINPQQLDANMPHFKKAPLLTSLMFAVIIGYLIQGLALFDVLPIYLNLFIVLAFASYIFSSNKLKANEPNN
ncbi:MAG: O-antigen ligase family protein [Candidatus Paceibacterota bacterium]|jgi:O-antigen ligase